MAELSVSEILVVLGVTLLLSVYFLYLQDFYAKDFYNKSFNISLAATALITAAVIITIQSSIVVSLGMVGALSIVRFRTAVTERRWTWCLCSVFWQLGLSAVQGCLTLPRFCPSR